MCAVRTWEGSHVDAFTCGRMQQNTGRLRGRLTGGVTLWPVEGRRRCGWTTGTGADVAVSGRTFGLVGGDDASSPEQGGWSKRARARVAGHDGKEEGEFWMRSHMVTGMCKGKYLSQAMHV